MGQIGKYTSLLKERWAEKKEFGNQRQRKISFSEFKTQVIKDENYAPVFFLSTGRTGTKLFTTLFEKSKHVKAYHNTKPEFIEQSKIVYEMSQAGKDTEKEALYSQIFFTGREDMMYKCHLHDKTFIETNNRITFFAESLKQLFPNAKFVYLYRHPGDFIRSGVMRKWYEGNSKSPHEIGRIDALKNNWAADQWADYDNIQKIAWLWRETNTYIEDFLKTIPANQQFSLNFSEKDPQRILELINFCGATDINQDLVNKIIATPINQQKKGNFPKYKDWKEEDKNKVKSICKDLCDQYKFKL